MNEIKTFTDKTFGTIRTLEINGEPYFVGKDIAKALGYTNPQKAIKDHVDEEDRTVNKSFTINGTQGLLINESGVYSLIILSKLPSAKKFKRWVTGEVLPSIRKHGAYMTDETLKKAITSPDFVMKLAQQLKDEQIKRQKLETKNEALIKENKIMKPKALFADCVSVSNHCITVAELAKIISQNNQLVIGEKRLFEYLRENNYLMNRLADRNTPTQKSIELGLFKIEDTVIIDNGKVKVSKAVKVTPKGQQYFIDKIHQYLI